MRPIPSSGSVVFRPLSIYSTTAKKQSKSTPVPVRSSSSWYTPSALVKPGDSYKLSGGPRYIHSASASSSSSSSSSSKLQLVSPHTPVQSVLPRQLHLQFADTNTTRGSVGPTVRGGSNREVAPGYIKTPLVDTEYRSIIERWMIDKHEIDCLGPATCLNGEVVSFAMDVINQRVLKGDTREKKQIFCFHSYLGSKLIQVLEKEPNNLTIKTSTIYRWMAGSQMDRFLHVVIPVHCRDNHHWTLFIINFVERRFEYYDSLEPCSTTEYKTKIQEV